MSLGRVIESPPDKQPGETEHSRYYENRAPTAEGVIEPHHKGRRDGGADGRTAVEQGHSPAAFGLGKPFGDSLCCAGPVGSLACTAQTEESHETPQALRCRGHDGRYRIPSDRKQQASASCLLYTSPSPRD